MTFRNDKPARPLVWLKPIGHLFRKGELTMPAFRLLGLIAAMVLASSACALAQTNMSPALTQDLRDVDVQKQLIALGVLDATAGRASGPDLGNAVAWFRKAYQFAGGTGPLTPAERQKLKESYDKFIARTGLQTVTYTDAATDTVAKLRVPAAFVGTTPQKMLGDEGREWWEYHDNTDNKVSVGPEIHLLAKFTPIALFRERIMNEPLKYKHLHLTSEEFAAEGEVAGDDGGYVSSNLVLTSKDRLKGVFVRYAKLAPKLFEVPEFLAPVVATEPVSASEATTDPKDRAWQLLMQGVANLVMTEFPFEDNGWHRVSTRPCPPAASGVQRILFGTDRTATGALNQKGGAVADPNSLFDNTPGNQLHLGCAYVSVPNKEVKKSGDLGESRITDFHLLHSTKKADIGDQLFLADEVAETSQTTNRFAGRLDRARVAPRVNTRMNASGDTASSALVFIHGYNTSFKDALFTVAQIVSATDYPGRIYMYSWPSAASMFGYIGDMDKAEQAEPFLQSFMKLLMRDADIDAIDILVHSMGSQSALRALSALRSVFETERQGTARQQAIRIGQIMFAAPDVAMPVFDQKIRRIAPYADRVTVYASMTDAALLASKILRSGAGRMGQLNDNGEPLLVEVGNVHLIDATGKEQWWRLDRIMSGYGHDYFLQSPGVRADIQQILKSVGQQDAITPKERSPERFEEKRYSENSKWRFWRLNDK
jgi:esterase/lipase superfamily enzyme